jgi:hypothetical protein
MASPLRIAGVVSTILGNARNEAVVMRVGPGGGCHLEFMPHRPTYG